eukprot:UN10676
MDPLCVDYIGNIQSELYDQFIHWIIWTLTSIQSKEWRNKIKGKYLTITMCICIECIYWDDLLTLFKYNYRI